MPTYEYICRACGHEFEEFQSIKADAIAVCPKCRKKKVERKIGIGGAVIFKGGGFYETDYRSDSYRSGEEAEKKTDKAQADAAGAANAGDKSSSKGDAKGDARTESKPESKSESKSESKPESKSESKSESMPESKSESKPESKPESKSDASAAAAENKRIESRATHQSRIGRGIGNIVGGAKKPASGKKPSSTTKRGRGK
jgi:putative FmdB family regulatory protein